MSKGKILATKGLSILLLLALLLSACGQTAPEVTPTAGEPTATLPPSATPPPTLTPMPLPPPRLAYRSPAPGEEQPLDAPLALTFDQPMNRASVEAAFTISPTVEGTFSWANDQTVDFSAAGGFKRGTRYQVTVAKTAKSAEGKTMEEPAAFDFSTVGYLAVSQVMPAPNSEGLNPDMTVSVVFDRPVVPLTSLSQQAQLPQPLTFVPPVKGTGEWLNTSIYHFLPAEGFAPATHYKARVAAGLTDTTGGVLAEDYTWEFTTIQPAVLAVSPYEDFQYVGPSEVTLMTSLGPTYWKSS